MSLDSALVAATPAPPDDRAWRVLLMAMPILDWDALDTIRDEVVAGRDYTLEELHLRFAGDSFTVVFLDDAAETDCGRFLAALDHVRSLRRRPVPVARSWTFSTPVDADDVVAALRDEGSYHWSLRESEYEGRYVLGQAPDGAKIKVMFYDDGTCRFEYWFSRTSVLDDAARDALATQSLGLLTERLHATDIQLEP